MKTLKLLVVANNAEWRSWPEKLSKLREWFSPKVDFDITLWNTSYAHVPFQASHAPGYRRIDDAWYNAHVSSLSRGHDIVLFVVPKRQWPQDNNAWGYRTDNSHGAVELQINCDEDSVMYVPNSTGKKDEYGNNISDAFFEQARHEILHALFFITGQPDTTHKWLADYNQVGFALEEIQFPKPNNASLPGFLSITSAWLSLVLKWLSGGMKGDMPEVPDEILPEPHMPTRKSLVRMFCFAIQEFEDYVPPGGKYRNGSVAPIGSLSYRNNNPGNVKWVPGQRLSTGADKRGFAVFRSYEDGFAFLEAMVRNHIKGLSRYYRPSMTFYEYFAVYAPAEDDNHPRQYAEFVAKKCGVSPNTQIGKLA